MMANYNRQRVLDSLRAKIAQLQVNEDTASAKYEDDLATWRAEAPPKFVAAVAAFDPARDKSWEFLSALRITPPDKTAYRTNTQQVTTLKNAINELELMDGDTIATGNAKYLINLINLAL